MSFLKLETIVIVVSFTQDGRMSSGTSFLNSSRDTKYENVLLAMDEYMALILMSTNHDLGI